MFQRFGPCLIGPPLSKEWQAAHAFDSFAPFSRSAVASMARIGSGSCGFAGALEATTGAPSI